jgi:hypothetical protein
MLPSLAATLPADAVVLYRLSASIAQPPLFEPGSDYEPISPAWIAALVPESDGMGAPIVYRLMWARAFGLTWEAQEARTKADREAEKEAKRALQDKAIQILSDLSRDVTGDPATLPGGMTWPDLRRCVKAARLEPYRWSRRACEGVLWQWAQERARAAQEPIWERLTDTYNAGSAP